MNKIISWVSLIIAILAVVIGSVALVGGNQQASPRLGGVTTGTAFPHGIQVGLATVPPTNIAGFLTGSCNLLGMDVSQPASSTRAYDCAVPGLTTSYATIAQLATSTATVSNIGPFYIESSKASTTPGFLTVIVRNNGAAGAPSIYAIGSSTAFYGVLTQ